MLTRTSGRRLAIVAATVASLGALRLEGQAATPTHRNVFSINPLGIPFEYFSAEFERSLSGLTSVGLTGSYLGAGNANYSTMEAKVRFYPNEEGPRGFSLGLAAGITRVGEDFGTDDTSETRPTVAVIVDYNWILGKAKRVVVGTGLGAKRILRTTGDYNDALTAYPTARFQIGIRY